MIFYRVHGMMECWNSGMLVSIGILLLMVFLKLLSRQILSITHFFIFPKPITPLFHYSNIPIVSEAN